MEELEIWKEQQRQAAEQVRLLNFDACTCQKDIKILILVESCLYLHVQYIYSLIQIIIMLGNSVEKPFIKLSKCKFFK